MFRNFFTPLFSMIGLAIFLAQPAMPQRTAETGNGFKIEFNGSLNEGRSGPAVSKQKTLFVARALSAKKILPLISMINFVETKLGAQVLDANLITPNPVNIRTWYYVIKQRSKRGRVTVKRYAATNGQEIR